VYVTTPDVTEKKAIVEVVSTVENSGKKDSQVSYEVKLLDPSGNEVGKSIMNSLLTAGQSTELKQIITVKIRLCGR